MKKRKNGRKKIMEIEEKWKKENHMKIKGKINGENEEMKWKMKKYHISNENKEKKRNENISSKRKIKWK